jgi:hypothetical protein
MKPTAPFCDKISISKSGCWEWTGALNVGGYGIVQSNGNYPGYTFAGFTEQGFARPLYTMQFPDVNNSSDGNTNNFLNFFLRGNRDDAPRKSEGSILQALNLMNNNTVVDSHLATTGTLQSQLLVGALNRNNTDLINTLFLNILSRYPSADEMSKAQASITVASGTGTVRVQAVQDLAWALYNKVDFIYNY